MTTQDEQVKVIAQQLDRLIQAQVEARITNQTSREVVQFRDRLADEVAFAEVRAEEWKERGHESDGIYHEGYAAGLQSVVKLFNQVMQSLHQTP